MPRRITTFRRLAVFVIGTALSAVMGLPAMPAVAAPATLFGASVAPKSGETFADAIKRQDGAYGRMPISRVFYNTPGPQPWPGDAGLSGRPVVVSFFYPPTEVTDGIHDAALRAWFDRAPRGYDVFWSYLHEPEDNVTRGEFSAAQYTAAWVHIAALARAAGNPQMRSTLILMCWTLAANSGLDWRNYYAGPQAVSMVAFDCYNHGWRQGNYTEPAKMFRDVTAWSNSYQIPWGIAEVGSVKMSWDSTGESRATWLHSIGAWLSGRAVFVNYFDVSKRTDYRLTDTPSKQAWRQVVAGN